MAKQRILIRENKIGDEKKYGITIFQFSLHTKDTVQKMGSENNLNRSQIQRFGEYAARCFAV